MTNGNVAISTPASNTYLDFISEVYIKPIRSTIIVDDKFPTLENFLNSQLENKTEGVKLLEIVTTCRSANWIVDVHDGSGDLNTSEFSRLHQSDLLILDYHLESDDTGGEKAIKVLKSLASNNYFNMVVIYTACKDINSEIPQRVLEVVEGLTFKSNNMHSDATVPAELLAWENEDLNIVNTLKSNFTKEDFIKLAQHRNTLEWKSILSTNLKEILQARCVQAKAPISLPIINWLYATRLQERVNFLADTDCGAIDFSLNEFNWIKTDKLFITIIAKSVDANKLPDLLLNALGASNISPHELIMARIRNALTEYGPKAEKKVLANQQLQAYWLKQMLTEKLELQDWRLQQTINHHWEALSVAINEHVQEFSGRLFNFLKSENPTDLILKHSNVDINNDSQLSEIIFEWNRNICSKAVDRPYVYTGQIFYIQEKGADKAIDGSYWICLTPACDLIPGQDSSWGGVGLNGTNLTPFKAVKLENRKNADAIKEATSSEFVFLNLNGNEINSYSYAKSSDGNPSWKQFFAHNNGYLTTNQRVNVSVIDVNPDGEAQLISAREFEAVIVAQLRYEYALHWMLKLSQSLSRIGLGFVKHTPRG